MRAMIHSVKDLSPDQKLAIESLLGRPISEGEQVSVRTVHISTEWLVSIQAGLQEKGHRSTHDGRNRRGDWRCTA